MWWHAVAIQSNLHVGPKYYAYFFHVMKNLYTINYSLTKYFCFIDKHQCILWYIWLLQMPKYKHRKSETLGPIRRNPSRRARVGGKTDPRNPRRHSDPVMDLDTSPTNVRPVWLGSLFHPTSLFAALFYPT